MMSDTRSSVDQFIDDLTRIHQTHFIEVAQLKEEYAKKIGILKQKHDESVNNIKIKIFESIILKSRHLD